MSIHLFQALVLVGLLGAIARFQILQKCLEIGVSENGQLDLVPVALR